MSSKFTDHVTVIEADWCNTVDQTVYTALEEAETPSEVRSVIGAVEEAPNDSTSYVRKNEAWSAFTGITDAPSDASPYVRMDEAWSKLSESIVATFPYNLGFYLLQELPGADHDAQFAWAMANLPSGSFLVVGTDGEDVTITDTVELPTDRNLTIGGLAGRVNVNYTGTDEAFLLVGTPSTSGPWIHLQNMKISQTGTRGDGVGVSLQGRGVTRLDNIDCVGFGRGFELKNPASNTWTEMTLAISCRTRQCTYGVYFEGYDDSTGSAAIDGSVARRENTAHMDGFDHELIVGSQFEVAGDLQMYTITKYTETGVFEGDVEFTPAAKQSWANDAVVMLYEDPLSMSLHNTKFFHLIINTAGGAADPVTGKRYGIYWDRGSTYNAFIETTIFLFNEGDMACYVNAGCAGLVGKIGVEQQGPLSEFTIFEFGPKAKALRWSLDLYANFQGNWENVIVNNSGRPIHGIRFCQAYYGKYADAVEPTRLLTAWDSDGIKVDHITTPSTYTTVSKNPVEFKDFDDNLQRVECHYAPAVIRVDSAGEFYDNDGNITINISKAHHVRFNYATPKNVNDFALVDDSTDPITFTAAPGNLVIYVTDLLGTITLKHVNGTLRLRGGKDHLMKANETIALIRDYNTTNWRQIDSINDTLAEAYTVTNASTDRTYNANSTTLDELADVLGTLIADLQTSGIIG